MNKILNFNFYFILLFVSFFAILLLTYLLVVQVLICTKYKYLKSLYSYGYCADVMRVCHC